MANDGAAANAAAVAVPAPVVAAAPATIPVPLAHESAADEKPRCSGDAVFDDEKATASAPKPATSIETSIETSTDSSSDSDNQLNGVTREELAKADSKLPAPKSAVAAAAATDLDAAFAHLPANEAEILRRQVFVPNIPKGAAVLYRYASRWDLVICLVSLLAAITAGVALPLMTVLFGNMQNTFQNYFSHQTTYDEFESVVTHNILYFVYLAVGEFITVYVSTVGFIYTGEHISAKIRGHYLESCLHQNIGFFDKLGAGEVTTRITADINLLQDGISEKIPVTVAAITTFVTAFIVGFVKSWKLTLILSSTFFALVFNMGAWSRVVIKNSKRTNDEYAEGGSLAAEAISSIRNAVAFGTQDRLADLYNVHLIRAEKYGFRAKAAIGIMVAGMLACLYLNYGLAFWMGSKYITDGSAQLSQVITVALAIIIGAFNIGNIAPNVQAFTTAIAAAAKIFNTIDRPSPLDPDNQGGDRLDRVEGTLRLENVKHIYPSRPEVVVMSGVSLTIPAGKTTALVGASGSGKSTIIGLVERFYELVGGVIYLDGHDISKLNLRWLRQQIALVSQEPTLFATTIYGNIAYGLIGSPFELESDDKKRELVYEAARKANAHDFINSLPEGYETHVGERGFLMSGGQKQRIAIARAIVSDPKILLLDEATSALDTKSEGVVQAALETASAGRTTITIAHRLSTIKDAHNIVVMSEGRIVEQGTHNDLLERRGAYFNLVTAQSIAVVNEDVDDEEKVALEKEDAMIRTASRKSGGVPVDPDDEATAAKLNRTTTTKSASSLALQGQKPGGAGEVKYGFWTLFKFIAWFNRPEWMLMIVGVVACVIAGGGNPTQSVFFAKEILVLSTPVTAENADQIRSDSDFWCRMYLMLGLVMFAAFATHGLIFAKSSERLVHRVRDQAFRRILRQDIAFFDQKENTVGALTSFLSTQATHVSGLSGVTLGTILLVLTTLIAALTLAIVIGWKLALVCASTVPVLLGCGFFRFWMLAHYQRKSRKSYASSATYASEAISSMRTVASLTREPDVLQQYQLSLERQQKAGLRSVLQSSLLYAASQSLTLLCFALGFWYGGTLIAKYEYNMFTFFLCFSAVIFGAQSAGTIFSFAPDMGKAHHAATELKQLFDRKPVIDAESSDGLAVERMDGTVEFRDVHFRYPTRPEQPVLRGLNLVVRPGQYVALVGASGCGKSTTIALLERFYDPIVGGVFVDGREIGSLNLGQYRSHLALVSQEPTLYQGTIRENILLGTPQQNVSEATIEHVCREANIHDFILSLPAGLDTLVGSSGALLSGGQKQRIAIARALIRDPRILLLDEATSALDSESEHVVQAALDKAARGRTTIAVAHRLSTIQNADIIYVFDQGRICEQGTHSELMKTQGRYAELVNLQSLGRN